MNFRRDPTIYDGRFANNGWLQELPKPVTKLTWDNGALMAPATAERLQVENGDIIEVTHEGRKLRIPIWINPGHAAEAITIHVGYGRTRAGRVGNGTGFNAYVLRGSASPWFGAAEITVTGDEYRLVNTQDHWSIEGRNILRSAPLEEFKKTPGFAQEMEEIKLDKPISLYAQHEYTGQQWGMAIDLNTCTGCMGVCHRLSGREQHPGRRQDPGGQATARCTGCASTATTRGRSTIRRPSCSRCRVSSARTRPAKWSARSRPRCTAKKA